MPTTEALLAETRWLTKLAKDLVGDPHAAEDVVQDTLLAALRERQRPIRSLRPWLQAVARNFAFRSRQRDKQRTHVERQSRAGQDNALPSAAEAVERASVHRSVVDAVLGLTEPYRSTIVLRYLEALPLAEVASRTGVPTETARSRQKRGIDMLRARLDSMYDGYRQAWSLMLMPFIPTSTAAAVAAGAVSSSVAQIAGITGILIMTTKAKLAAVAMVCGVLLATLWVLQEPSGQDGLPLDPAGDPGGGSLVAEGEGGGKMAVQAAKDPSERTEMPRQPVAKPKFGSLLVRVVWGADQKPAPSVMLRAWYARHRNSLFDRNSGIADKDGTLRLEGLWPGPMFVQSYRGDMDGGQKVVHIKAGKEVQVQILVPVGLNLSGIVVDQAGNPVAGADVIVRTWHGQHGGCADTLAKSGVDGRFHLRAISVNCTVGARSRGHAPSPLYTIVGSKGSNLKVRIVLGGRGGGIFGRVLDPRGHPVENAVIQVGEEPQYPGIKLPDGSRGLMPMPVRVRSDRDGHFIAVGLAPGRSPVAVQGKGLAPWFGTVDVPAGGDSELLVRLLPAATVSGTVWDGDGRSLAKVLVKAVSAHGRVFGDPWMRTKADGNYSLEGLGPGKLEIRASSEEGKAETELDVVAGQTLQWNPVLVRGLVLRGRVVDEQGRPVQVPVSASLEDPGKDPWWRWVKTDKEGRFVLKGCLPGKKIRIRVQSKPEAIKPYANRSIVVTPEQKNVVIHVQSLGKPSVYITGQVLDPDGKPIEDCRIVPFARQHHVSQRLPNKAGSGRFKYGPYPPGEYCVRIEAKGYPRILTHWRKLNKDDTWDLGVIRMQHPGFLQVKLTGETALLPENARLLLRDATENSFASVRVRKGKAERSDPLAPGTYYLQVMGNNCLCARHRFEIHAGQDTHLEVPVERGTPVVLEFTIKANERLVAMPRGEWISVEIKDSTGRMILTRAASRVRNDEHVRRLEFATRPGKYMVTATTSWTGARGEAVLTVGDKPADPNRIVLR